MPLRTWCPSSKATAKAPPSSSIRARASSSSSGGETRSVERVTSIDRAKNKNDTGDKIDVSGLPARVARLCLAWLAGDPSPETLALVSAATRTLGVADVESTDKPGAGIDEGVVLLTTLGLALALTCIILASQIYN